MNVEKPRCPLVPERKRERTAIRVFNRFRKLKQKPYWGNHFWAKGYCVDTVGLDADKIARYVKYQEAKERQTESRQQHLF